MQTRQRLGALGPVALLAAASLFSAGCGGGGSNGAGSTSTAGTPTTPTTPPTTPTVVVPTRFTTIDGPGGSPTTFNGISNSGTVAGFTTASAGTANAVNANFLRSSGGTVTALNLGDPAGTANAVNANGTVVGAANGKAFVLTGGAGGTPTALAPFGATASTALGVSDGGTIVGQYAAAGGTAPGFVDVNGAFTSIAPAAAATMTFPQAVNNNGIVAGFYSTAASAVQHGFLYNVATQQATLLPDPVTARTASGGLALTQFLGLNDGGEAVGYYQTTNGSQYGFLFNTLTQTYTYLDEPNAAAPAGGVQITQITGVTNAGTICGFYIDSGGVQHGFTATP